MPDEFQSEPRFAEIIGTSPELKLALALAQSAAVNDSPVFILGETGSGKKLIARAIHQSSARRFVNLVIDYLTQSCWMRAAQLYESPFTDFSPRGVEGCSTQRK